VVEEREVWDVFRVTVLAGVLDGGGFFDGMMSVVSLFLSLGY
jgi:hypothetical protein